jgi:hypothetical protein
VQPDRIAPTHGLRDWTAQQAFVAFLPGLFLAALVMFVPPMMVDGDPLSHIATGQWMIAHGAVPHSDPFSYTAPGAPWNAHEWLSELLMAEAYRLAGLSGLNVLFGFAVAATGFFLAVTLLRFLPPVPALIVLTFALAHLGENIQARPHILVLPVLVLWMGELLAARQEQRAPGWILIPVMVLWANLHGSFFLGLCLLAAFAFEAAIAAKEKWPQAVRSWAMISAGSLLAALVTPTGVWGLVFPLKLMAMTSLSLIREWQSAIFVGLTTFEVCLLGALFFCLMRGVKIPVIRLLLLLALLHEALQHRRHITIVVLIGAMLLAEPIAGALKSRAKTKPTLQIMRWAGSAALLFMLGLSGVRLAIAKPLVDANMMPVTALSHVPQSIARQPVFNQYDLGGYLMFIGVRPFIDGRADMYGDAFMTNYARIVTDQDKNALQQTFAKYGVVWTVFASSNPFNAYLDELPGWRTLYQDKFAVVHVRGDVLSAAGN